MSLSYADEDATLDARRRTPSAIASSDVGI
jgi:hypothetical protein